MGRVARWLLGWALLACAMVAASAEDAPVPAAGTSSGSVVLMRSTARSARPLPTTCTARLARAAQARAPQLVVLQIDTPGGLDTVDARHHQGHPRLAGAGGRLRRAERRARRQRRHLHPLRQPHRGDGAGHQPRRGHAGAIGMPGGGAAPSSRRRRRIGARRRRARTERRDDAQSTSTTPRPTSAAWRSCAAATPTGPRRRCARRSACRPSEALQQQGDRPHRRRRARSAAQARRPRGQLRRQRARWPTRGRRRRARSSPTGARGCSRSSPTRAWR